MKPISGLARKCLLFTTVTIDEGEGYAPDDENDISELYELEKGGNLENSEHGGAVPNDISENGGVIQVGNSFIDEDIEDAIQPPINEILAKEPIEVPPMDLDINLNILDNLDILDNPVITRKPRMEPFTSIIGSIVGSVLVILAIFFVL